VERLSENLDIFDFELPPGQMSEIAGMAHPKGRLTDFGFAPKWD
jgi:diketogulonate reductase-like aldo/keto reductase